MKPGAAVFRLVQSDKGEVLGARRWTPCSPKVGHLACQRGGGLRHSAGELLSASHEIINLNAVLFVLVFTRYTEML